MSKVRKIRKPRKKRRLHKPNFNIQKHNGKYTVSACMIVKNEVLGIRKAIESLIPLVDEIVIVDTGSVDGTTSICKEYNKVKLVEQDPILFMTEDEDGFNRIDFAATRNLAQEHVTSDWVFVLDGDEHIIQADGLHHHIEELEEVNCNHAYVNVYVTDDSGGGDFLQVRLYKNDNTVKWTQPVHNKLVGLSDVAGRIPLEIHTSYNKSVRSSDKDARAEPMLLKAARIYQEETWSAFYLAGLYLHERKPEKAKLWARRALINPKDPTVARAWYWLIHATLMTDGMDEAEKLLYQALSLHPNYPDLNWMRTVYALARWDVVLQSPESQQYMVHPQRSYSIRLAQVAKHLEITWPFVKVKQREV